MISPPFIAVIAAIVAWLDPTPAHAGFAPLIVAFAELLTVAGLTAAASVAIASVAVPVLIIGGLLAAQALLKPHGSSPTSSATGSIDPGRARDTFEDSESPELRAVGRVRVGGLKAFGNTAGVNRYRMTLHVKGPIDGFENFYFAGREIVADIDTDGAVSSFPWAKPTGSWAYLLVKKGDGTETAWPWLLADFPDIWTSAHRVRGIAQSLAQFVNPGFSNDKFLQLYQGGVPDVEVVIRAELVYDPRTALTAWGENGIVNAQHILLSYPEFSLADLDLAFMASEADRADALIATRAGNVARSRCWGPWSSETQRGTNMQAVLDSIGAWIIPRTNGTQIGIQLIDDDPAAEVTIAQKNIVSIDWQSGPSDVERPNIARVKYYSPEQNYAMAQIALETYDNSGVYNGPAWAYVADEVTASGKKYLDLEYPFCPNAGQAQRNARRDFLMARADSGIIKTNLAGLAVFGRRIVNFEFPDDLGTLKCKIGAPRVIDDQGQVEIPFVVWPTLSAWNTSTDEVDAPDQIPDLAVGSPLTTPDQPTAACIVSYQASLGTATRVHYTVPVDAVTVEVSYRTYTGVNPNSWSTMTEYVASGYNHAYVNVDNTGKKADFRVRTFDASDNGSSWSPVLQVASLAVDNTAPGLASISGSINVGGLFEFTINVVAPTSLDIAYMTQTGTGAPTINAIRPGESFTWSPTLAIDDNIAFTSTAKSTNGTSGATATLHASHSATIQFAACGQVGGSAINVFWAEVGAGVSSIEFTGAGAPSPQGPGTGSWTASGLSAGAHVFTMTSYDGSHTVLGSGSIIVTI